jgi:uncharacterized protein (TIGR03435 family)
VITKLGTVAQALWIDWTRRVRPEAGLRRKFLVGAVSVFVALGTIVFSLLNPGNVIAQSEQAAGATRGPTFEVATVKPSPSPEQLAASGKTTFVMGSTVTASRAEYRFLSLKQLIAEAYKLDESQITGPPWLVTERFDIVAKLPDGAAKADVPKMLRALLEDRFKLAAHLDTQERPVLALVVAKYGPKLKESPAAEPIDPNAPLKPGERMIDGPNGPVRERTNPDGSITRDFGARGIVTQKIDLPNQTMSMETSRMTMGGLADLLTNVLARGGGDCQVVDKTGLNGHYQVAVEFSLGNLVARARAQGLAPMPPPGAGSADSPPDAAASDPDRAGSSVYAAVKKLGLKLEPSTAPVEQLIVDHMEKSPTED